MPQEGIDRGTCWIEIDLGALRSNFRVVRDHLEKNIPILAVVKANAYGHGAVPVSRASWSIAAVLSVRAIGDIRK